MSKFEALTVGQLFFIDGEKYKKTGPSTYVSLENPILGEYTIQPITEGKIQVPDNSATKASVTKKKRGK